MVGLLLTLLALLLLVLLLLLALTVGAGSVRYRLAAFLNSGRVVMCLPCASEM